MVRKDEMFRLDWIRIQIPFSYEPVNDEFAQSQHHHKLAIGKVTNGFGDVCKSLLSILAIDEPNNTNLEYFEFHDGGKPYDARYSREGFDLRFNSLNTNAEAPVGRIQMGLKLDIQGRGCRYIEHALARDGHNWKWFFLALVSAFPDVTFRRIDVARDYFKNTRHLTPWAIGSRFEKERRNVALTGHHGKFVITRRHSFTTYHAGDATDGNVKGSTFYLGAPSDNLMLRIYDKQAERIYGHGDTWRNNGKYKKYWYRWEVQSSGDVANKIGHLLADGVSGINIWLSCINRMFAIAPTPLERKRGHFTSVSSSVYDPRNQKYIKKDIDVADWWADWINNDAIDKYHLTTIVHLSDIEGSDKWLYGPVTHVMVERLIVQILRGGDPKKLLQHWIDEGKRQLNFNDINLIKSKLTMLNDFAVKELTKGSDFSQQIAPVVNMSECEINKRYADEKRIAERNLDNSQGFALTLKDYLASK